MGRAIDGVKGREWEEQLRRYADSQLTVGELCVWEDASIAAFYVCRKQLARGQPQRRMTGASGHCGQHVPRRRFQQPPLTATETAPHFLRPCLLRRIRLNGISCCVSFPAAAVAGQSEPSFGGSGEPVEPNARQVGEGCGSAGASPSRGGVPYREDGGTRLGRSLALPRAA
ncbi:MAG: hypothetical protein RIT02_793 [Planctomycetota bacterium]